MTLAVECDVKQQINLNAKNYTMGSGVGFSYKLGFTCDLVLPKADLDLDPDNENPELFFGDILAISTCWPQKLFYQTGVIYFYTRCGSSTLAVSISKMIWIRTDDPCLDLNRKSSSFVSATHARGFARSHALLVNNIVNIVRKYGVKEDTKMAKIEPKFSDHR